MPTLARIAVLLCAQIAWSGCSGDREAELLGVHEVEPDQLEPGRAVVVRGSGFPPGREARVRFDGMLHEPGAHPRMVRVEIAGRAVSAERVEALFTRENLFELGGRGTLRGRATVLFSAADGHRDVIGRSDELVVDVVRSERSTSADTLADHRAGTAITERLGISLGEGDLEEAGLPIEAVTGGSVAERVGIIAGDRLVELDEIRVHAVADLVPPPGAQMTQLRIERRGEVAPFDVRIPLEVEREGLREEAMTTSRVALLWLLLTLILLAPSAGVVDWLGRRARRSGGGRREARSRIAMVRDALRFAPVLGLVVTAAACIPALDRAELLTVPLEATLVLLFALRASAAWLASSGETLRDRTLAVVHATSSIGLVAIAFLGTAALGGTTDFSTLGAQGLQPLDWTLFTTPVAPLLLGVGLVGAGTAPTLIARGTSGQARIARTIDDVLLLAIAAMLAGILLGGWKGNDSPEVVGAALFVGFTVGIWLWARRSRRISRTTRKSVLFMSLFGLGTAVVTVARILAETPPELERALAQVTGGAVALLTVLVIARLLMRRNANVHEPAHPFI